jgi:hydrogenase nickel incorporation protein HypA/HybF
MHELSIAMALVEDVERALFRDAAATSTDDADATGAAQPKTFFPGAVSLVRVRIGKLSGVDAEALKQAFPVAAENTCCNAAQLAVTEIETQATCHACGAEFMPEFGFCVCTECDSTDVEITGGRELLLESVELNDTERG